MAARNADRITQASIMPMAGHSSAGPSRAKARPRLDLVPPARPRPERSNVVRLADHRQPSSIGITALATRRILELRPEPTLVIDTHAWLNLIDAYCLERGWPLPYDTDPIQGRAHSFGSRVNERAAKHGTLDGSVVCVHACRPDGTRVQSTFELALAERGQQELRPHPDAWRYTQAARIRNGRERVANTQVFRQPLWDQGPRVCGNCGEPIKHIRYADVAHDKAAAQGGRTDYGNLYLSCLGCNRWQNTRSRAAFMDDDLEGMDWFDREAANAAFEAYRRCIA